MSAVLLPQREFVPMQGADLDELMPIENDIYPFPWTRANFIDAMASGYSAWVYREDSALLGYTVCMGIVDEVHILNLSVARSRQGQGYGARLLRFVMDLFTASGSRRILLEVRPSNASALKLYRQFGFTRIGLRKNYYPAPGGREDALVMARDLPA